MSTSTQSLRASSRWVHPLLLGVYSMLIRQITALPTVIAFKDGKVKNKFSK